MSHNNDTLSRAVPENNPHENSIISPSPHPGPSKRRTATGALVLGAVVISGLFCVTALAGAALLFFEGLIRGDEAPKQIAAQWIIAAGASVLGGWAASLVGFSFLIWRERGTRYV